MFARVFRKHLEGGFIKAIRQVGNDRRIEIDIESKDEMVIQYIELSYWK